MCTLVLGQRDFQLQCNGDSGSWVEGFSDNLVDIWYKTAYFTL